MKIMTAEEWDREEKKNNYEEYMHRIPTEDMQAYGDYVKKVCEEDLEFWKEFAKYYVKQNIEITEEKPKTYIWEEVPVGHEFTTEGSGWRFLKLSDNSYLDTSNNVVWHSLWGLTPITSHKPVEWEKE